MSEGNKSKAGSGHKNGGKKSGAGLLPVNWFNPQPNALDIKWLAGNANKLPDTVIELVDHLSEKDRVSLKYDPGSNRWVAVLFVPHDGASSSLDALSCRGATAFDAAVLLSYFHLVRFADGWEMPDATGSGRYG